MRIDQRLTCQVKGNITRAQWRDLVDDPGERFHRHVAMLMLRVYRATAIVAGEVTLIRHLDPESQRRTPHTFLTSIIAEHTVDYIDVGANFPSKVHIRFLILCFQANERS